jgi:WD40 repeat protein
VAWSSDGERVFTASADGTARVWATRQGEPLAPEREATEIAYLYSGGELERLRVESDGRAVLAAPDAPLDEGTALEGTLDVGTGIVGAILSPEGDRLAIADGVGGIVVFDTDSGAIVSEHAPVEVDAGVSPPLVEDLGFSPDGTRVASSTGIAGSVADPTPARTEVWDVESGETVAQVRAHGPDGTAEQVASRLAWLGDDGLLTGGSSGEVEVWDAATGEASGDPYDEGAGEFVVDLAVSDDGERVLSISQSGTARVWEADSGDTLATHTNRPVNQGALSPDGSLVVTGGTDGALEVWDGTSGDVLARYEQPDQPSILGFDPDEAATFLVTAYSGRRLDVVTPRQFSCEQCGGVDDLVAYAEDRVTRDLTDEERERFLSD